MTENSEWIIKKNQELEFKLNLQKEYCNQNNLPCFVEQCPECPKCKVPILLYCKDWEVKEKHITSCSICGFSLIE